MNPYYEPYWLNEDELEHYGVKGMKWKQHIKRKNVPSLTGNDKRVYTYDASKYSKPAGTVTSYRENGKMVEYELRDINGKLTGGGTRPATEEERRMWALRKIDRIEDNVEATTGNRETAKKVGDLLQKTMDTKLSDILKKGIKTRAKAVNKK